MKYFKVLIIITILFSATIVDAQDSTKVDSLVHELQTAVNGEKVNLLIQLAFEQRTPEKAEEYLIKAIDESIRIEDLAIQQEALNQIIQFYYSTVNFEKAEKRLLEQEKVSGALGDSLELSMVYTRIGVIRKNSGKYDEAIVYYQKALELQEKMGDLENAGYTLLNIGNVYFYFLPGDDFSQALKYYNLALDNFSEIEHESGVALCKLNIGQVNSDLEKFDIALKYTLEAKQTFEELRDFRNYVNSVSMLGGIYTEQEEYQKAEKELLQLKNMLEESGDFTTTFKNYGALGSLYTVWEKPGEALIYYKRALEIALDADMKSEASDIYREMSVLYEQTQNYDEALESYKEYSNMRDSIFNEETSKQINEIQTKYETEKKQQEIELLHKEQEKKQVVTNALIAGIFLLVILAFLVYNRYRLKKKANEKLSAQNDEISEQRDKIMEQKEEITDSIQYAKRIQTALLPPVELLDQSFEDYFVFFKPRDIVSGDFYWMTSAYDKIYIAAADCTGHGVPGAFMSMLGISFLNEIVSKDNIETADVILNKLRDNVIESLRQTGKANEAKDGMDISLSIIDNKNMKLQFAGAYNPLYIIRDEELITYKANKMPIGIYFREQKPFTNHEIEIKKSDRLYMFSDGYIDQFGEESGRKFMSKRYKQLLLDVHKLPMKEQKKQLDLNMIKWQGTNSQLDDMLIVGIKI